MGIKPKTQKEILRKTQKPYIKSRGNPNPLLKTELKKQTGIDFIRANQTSFKDDTTKPIHLGLTDINDAIFYYFNNIIQPSVIQNQKQQIVPVIYADGEAWKSYRRDRVYRDRDGKIMSPIIAIKRDNISEKRDITNKIDAQNPYLYQSSTQKYHKSNRYSNFDILNNRVPIKTHYMTVIPDYKLITYSGIIQTYYIEQLDTLIENIGYNSGSYWGDPEKWKFKTIIKDFSTKIDMFGGNERVAKSEFKIELHAYLIPDNIQKDKNSIKKQFSKARVNIETETVVGKEFFNPNINNIKPQYSNWLLINGIWDDIGVWVDEENWIDS